MDEEEYNSAVARESMCVNEKEGGRTVRLPGAEVKKVQVFKYSGSTVQECGEGGKEMKKSVQMRWRKGQRKRIEL